MNTAQSPERLVSKTWPERRVACVDFDPTSPMRRAADLRPMANVLALQAFKASEKRFTGESITNLGGL